MTLVLSDIIAFAGQGAAALLTTPVAMPTGVISASYHERYNQTVRGFRELTVPLVDAAALFRLSEYYDNPKADFIHYNAKGAERNQEESLRQSDCTEIHSRNESDQTQILGVRIKLRTIFRVVVG
jgi:hypothetical protein